PGQRDARDGSSGNLGARQALAAGQFPAGLRAIAKGHRALSWVPPPVRARSGPFDVQVLIARSFDPRDRIRPQFTPFPVGIPLGNDTNLPWATLRVFGFELVDQLYITSSASVDFDNIVLT